MEIKTDKTDEQMAAELRARHESSASNLSDMAESIAREIIGRLNPLDVAQGTINPRTIVEFAYSVALKLNTERAHYHKLAEELSDEEEAKQIVDEKLRKAIRAEFVKMTESLADEG